MLASLYALGVTLKYMQMKRFETQDNIDREDRAIKKFCEIFKGSSRKLGPNDIDFRLYDRDGHVLGYAEVKGRHMPMRSAFPLPVGASKVVKLCEKRVNPVIIWACDDGIIYGKPMEIEGRAVWGGRKPRPGAVNDQRLMIYYKEQENLTHIPYGD
jgi:hypothetical protein